MTTGQKTDGHKWITKTKGGHGSKKGDFGQRGGSLRMKEGIRGLGMFKNTS